MFAHRIKAHVKPDQPLILPLPKGLPEGEVEVIVLFPEAPVAGGARSTLREFDAWLRQQPLSQRGREEMDRQITEERASWE